MADFRCRTSGISIRRSGLALGEQFELPIAAFSDTMDAACCLHSGQVSLQ